MKGWKRRPAEPFISRRIAQDQHSLLYLILFWHVKPAKSEPVFPNLWDGLTNASYEASTSCRVDAALEILKRVQAQPHQYLSLHLAGATCRPEGDKSVTSNTVLVFVCACLYFLNFTSASVCKDGTVSCLLAMVLQPDPRIEPTSWSERKPMTANIELN